MPRRRSPAARIVVVQLAYLLEERDMSMRSFAERSGICYPSVLALCHNRSRRVDFATLERVCATLGVEPSDVLHLERSTA